MRSFKAKNTPKNQGFTHVLLIIVGIILSAILIGFFTTSYRKNNSPSTGSPSYGTGSQPSSGIYPPNLPSPIGTGTVNFNPSCGIIVFSPYVDQRIYQGFLVKGSENGCGWGAFEAQAGSVQAFKSDGTAVSSPAPLLVIGNWMQANINFQATLNLNTIPSQGSGGFLLFRNEDAAGNNPKFFKVLVNF
jgi:hypothetical protein